MSEQPVTEQPAAVPAAAEQSAVEQPLTAEQQSAAVPAPPLPSGPPLPPGPPIGPYDPAQLWAVPPHLAPPVRRKRTWVRTALRWSTAVVVCAAVGAGTAMAGMSPRRTDIPGLRTPADSRYAFPRLKLPPLPPKADTPAQDRARTGNQGHAADLRKLLLPAPLGAKADSSLPGATGWYPTASYVTAMGGDTELGSELSDFGVRHITARGWTTPDGVSTTIYLLGFRSDSDANHAYVADLSSTRPKAAVSPDTDTSVTFPGFVDSTYTGALSQAPAPGRPGMRIAFVNVGDVEAVVVMSSGTKAVPLVNFRQVVALQGELLQG